MLITVEMTAPALLLPASVSVKRVGAYVLILEQEGTYALESGGGPALGSERILSPPCLPALWWVLQVKQQGPLVRALFIPV